MAGVIFVDGQRIDKAGTPIDEAAEITIKEYICSYVSRGGLKLEKALELFEFSLKDAFCMDIGASTGGFTDCMLKNGAKKVYAVDVGYGQLDWKLRNDSRVINMEKVNIRYLDTSLILEKLNFISVDVSFISLKLIFPVAASLLSEDGSMVCLIKPQFEAGKDQVGKKGIVRESSIHEEVICKVIMYAEGHGLYPKNLTYSPVTGAKGNIEYLIHLDKNFNNMLSDNMIKDIVNSAHNELG